jgi:hypothetical protein
MANEHIARLQKIGLGLETTSGTAVAPTFWLPKGKGLLTPKTEYKYDQGAYGNRDKNREAYITSKWSELTITDTEPRDVWIGHFLKALFGLAYPCVKFSISGSITGTYVEGEVITESTSSATGTLRRLDAGGSSKALYIEPLAGTFVGGGKTLTGGTSAATCVNGTIESPTAVRHHIFRRITTNNPPSYTISANDPVSGDEKAAYCVLDTLDMECQADDIIKFAMKFMGQPMVSSATLTPAYTSENPFLGKHISFKTASAFNSLDAASAIAIEKVKVSGNNNVEMIHQTAGSDPLAPTSLHCNEFEMKGDFSGVFNATTIRDAALAGTAQSLRLALVNTTTIGSAANPTLQFDFPEVYYNDWGKDDDNAKIVRQNVGFTAVYNVTRALTAEAILINTRTTTY